MSATPPTNSSTAAVMWDPTGDAAEDSSAAAMVVDAAPGLRVPVLVHTTCGEMRRLCQRVRAEPPARLVELSNGIVRRMLAQDALSALDPTSLEWQRLCGDVLVFYAVRHARDGALVPTRADAAAPSGSDSPLAAA